VTPVNLSPGERIAIEPSLTTSIEGLSQAFERIDDDKYLAAWTDARDDGVTAKGDPRGRIKRIRDFFRDRTYVRDLCTDVPYQVPILTVAPVPHGTVNATYSVERSGEGGASLKILGSGGGAGFKTVLSSSFEFDADRADQMSSLVSDVLITAHLFEYKGRSEVITDLRLADDAFVRVDAGLPDLAPGSAGRVVARLRAADPARTGKFTVHTERTRNWNVDIGLKFDMFGGSGEASLSYEAEKTNGVEAVFVLPNGFDYSAYDWPAGGSLIPRIAPVP
jgi:hypothetical protein